MQRQPRGGGKVGGYWRHLPLSDQPADPGDRRGGAEQGSSHPDQASGCLQDINLHLTKEVVDLGGSFELFEIL